jgi:signal transduction histidine kinase/CheY-like chemotaxis protein
MIFVIMTALPMVYENGVISLETLQHMVPIVIWCLYFFLIASTGGFRSPYVLLFVQVTSIASHTGFSLKTSPLPIVSLVGCSYVLLMVFEYVGWTPFPDFTIACQSYTNHVKIVVAAVTISGFHRSFTFRDLFRDSLEAERNVKEAQADFVANVSHEIRTPLTSIMGWAEVLLRAKSLPSEMKDRLEIIRRCSYSLLTIITDILDFSKIEKGKFDLENTPFNPEAVTRGVLESSAVLVRPEVEFINDVNLESVPTLLGDPHRFSQILTNFISNAAKFTLKGSIRVSASLRERISSPGGQDVVILEFRCLDGGIGMSTNTLETIFQPFKQADSSTTRRFGGTGLGLAITKRLVAAMGGDIRAYSTLGVGSEFVWSLKFPVAREPPRPATPRTWGGNDEATRGLRVLLVEDNQFNQQIITHILSSLSCKVTVANNGEEAVLIARTSLFDVIFMDVQMPLMDGYEATKRIHQHFSFENSTIPPPPVVGLTANADLKTREKCIKSGMIDVLPKPIQMAALRTLLTQMRGRT